MELCLNYILIYFELRSNFEISMLRYRKLTVLTKLVYLQCNSTCGIGYQTRPVVCVYRQSSGRTSIVGDNYCTGEEKPSTYMSCDLESCGPQWYMNDWGRVGDVYYNNETIYTHFIQCH